MGRHAAKEETAPPCGRKRLLWICQEMQLPACSQCTAQQMNMETQNKQCWRKVRFRGPFFWFHVNVEWSKGAGVDQGQNGVQSFLN